MSAPIVLIMGPPGAGKGTQAAHLVERWSLRHVATGDLLRAQVADGSDLGREAQRYMDAGELVPDEVIIGMLRDFVCDLDKSDGVLLDGFPRTTAQAEALAAMLADLGRDIDVVLDVRVPDDMLVERLSGRWTCPACQTPYNLATRPPAVAGHCDRDGAELRQRDDDRPEAVRNRLAVYHRQTAPVADWYRAHGRLVAVDGDQSADVVQAVLDDAVVHATTPA